MKRVESDESSPKNVEDRKKTGPDLIGDTPGRARIRHEEVQASAKSLGRDLAQSVLDSRSLQKLMKMHIMNEIPAKSMT